MALSLRAGARAAGAPSGGARAASGRPRGRARRRSGSRSTSSSFFAFHKDARALSRGAPAHRRLRPGRRARSSSSAAPGAPRRPRRSCCSLGYWALDAARARLDPQGNLAARIDQAVFGRAHVEARLGPGRPALDAAGDRDDAARRRWPEKDSWRARPSRTDGSAGSSSRARTADGRGGSLWGRVLPVNKSLWTSSYALLMSGLACDRASRLCFWIVDVRGWKRWAAPRSCGSAATPSPRSRSRRSARSR